MLRSKPLNVVAGSHYNFVRCFIVLGKSSCTHITDYLDQAGLNPGIRAEDGCFVFDQDIYEGRQLSAQNRKSVEKFCGVRFFLASQFSVSGVDLSFA